MGVVGFSLKLFLMVISEHFSFAAPCINQYLNMNTFPVNVSGSGSLACTSSSNPSHVAISGEDGSIIFMSPSDKTIHPSKIIRNGMITALCISPWDGNIFCSSDDDNSLVHYSPFPSCTYTTLLYRSTLLTKRSCGLRMH